MKYSQLPHKRSLLVQEKCIKVLPYWPIETALFDFFSYFSFLGKVQKNVLVYLSLV